ncbi:unnamed protein product [Vitrella brassicaformis CCMP3155]|uniref:Serine aminopeptidase S33 domain-containing protein n=1 Tax=Vitrella brassicaformis (strain CCMP3155) TaxID=1169540 RepID=A0A0G4GRT1_VITBC|nr:unnamed protein product [Vitrella brassicaformis CCMP3155]|eukprot:CEM33318.1 unnamed protein product [Vitrella brassicaformis CCMP3155]
MTTTAPEWSFLDDKGVFTVTSGLDHNLVCEAKLNQPSSREAIVLCHGYLADRTSHVIDALFHRLPLNTVRFDFHGCGESDGHDQWSYGGYLDEVDHDMKAVIDFIRSKGIIVQAVAGHSRGGNNVLIYAGRHDDVPLVINIAGRYDMSRGIKERFTPSQLSSVEEEGGYFEIQGGGATRKVYKKCIDNRKAIDMKEVIAKVGTKGGPTQTQRVLTIHGEKDTTIPVEDGEAIHSLLGEKGHLKVIPEASHMFDHPDHLHDVVETSKDFLNTHLQKG